MRYAMIAMPRRPFPIVAAALLSVTLWILHVRPAFSLAIRPHNAAHMEQQVVEQLEDQIRRALLSGDAPTLDKVLADDFLGISANGTLSNKQQYLRRIGKREHQFSKIDVIERKVRVQPASAIVVTTADVVGKLDSVNIDGIFRYTRVYSRDPGGPWKLRNFEATRVSGQAADELHRGTPMARPAKR